jgi:predicted TIM-barrel fold metal-dependent hydrolase
MDRVLLVSADAHAGLPTPDYRPYLEREYHEQFDSWMAEGHRLLRTAEDNLQRMSEAGGAVSQEALDEMRARREFATIPDSTRRLKELEQDGIVAEVIYPDITGNIPPFSSHFAGPLGARSKRVPIELKLAGERAHNRWIAEFCAPNAERELGLALVSFADVDVAVAEVRRAADAGLKGILLSEGVVDGETALYDASFEPLWSTCEEAGIAVHSHGGTGCPDYPWSDPVTPWFVYSELHFFAHRPLWWMIWGGVLDRHPALRLIFAEQGAEWVVDALARMDYQYEGRGGRRADGRHVLPLKPSEYWARQCFVVCSLEFSKTEADRRNEIGVASMLFGTDYPHQEGTWGYTLPYLRRTIGASGMSEGDARAILGTNAAEAYGMDTALLAPLVERIGPTVDQVLTASGDPLPEYLEMRLTRPSYV